MIFQLLPSQLQAFNQQMTDALVRRGEIEIYSDDCEQFLGELFGRIYSKFDMDALNAVLNQPKIFDWLIDRAVENRKLSFKSVTPPPQVIERVVEVEKPVEVIREVAPRQYPGSRMTSSTDISRAAAARVAELQREAQIEEIVKAQVERYRELQSESLYATAGRGTHSDNNAARRAAAIVLDQFIARMHPATKRFLNLV